MNDGIGSVDDFLRAVFPWLYRDEDPEDYPPGTDWRPADDLLSSTSKN